MTCHWCANTVGYEVDSTGNVETALPATDFGRNLVDANVDTNVVAKTICADVPCLWRCS